MDELICPRCGTRMRYNAQHEKIMCPQCQYAPIDARQAEVKARGPHPGVKISHRGQINRNARAAYNSGHHYLHEGQPEKALEAFKRAIFFQPDFTDAHIAIADLVDDEQTKRDHLGVVIAFDGSNLEAVRRLMVLDGRLTAEEAARTYHYDDQQVEHIDLVETKKAEVLLCPVCGGQLTVNDENGQVECKYCGYVEIRAPSRKVGVDMLAMALLERKAKPVRWVVGQRILHCNQCGAERTIPARNLTHECPFCGSQHVVQQEAIESLEQPDGLVPFRISRQQAGENIKAELQRLTHRIANLFDKNRIAHGTVEPVYLPFWVFDAVADVTETRVVVTTDSDMRAVLRSAHNTLTFTDSMSNVAVCGVTSPPPELTGRLGPFDYGEMVAYQSKLLAKYPAELYNIDFDKASLEARGIISKALREKHNRRDVREDSMRISASSAVKNMSFRLVLLPVWVARLIEVDSDTRVALVNGQTGRVALGQVQKSS